MESGKRMLRDIKPALTGYLKKSQILLDRDAIPDEEAVHDLRVLMKKSRAVLKLISGEVEKETFDRDYNTYREIGRILCSMREASVHRKTLKYLKNKYREAFKGIGEKPGIMQLLNKPGYQDEPAGEMKEKLELVRELLFKAAYRLRFQAINDFDESHLFEQLQNSYRNVSEVYLDCRRNPKQSNIHLLRKRSKDLLYQLWFFKPLNLQGVKSLCKKLDQITGDIGKSNDLAVLLNELERIFKDDTESVVFQRIMLAIREEQDRILARVWPVASRVFSPGFDLAGVSGLKIV